MQIDMSRPNPARVLDYWLGGTHNFEIDRQFSDQVTAMLAALPEMQRQARRKLRRVVAGMVLERQLNCLVDLGAGLPTCENTHFAAGAADPNARVLYSDIDPLTVAYGKQILARNPNVRYVQADAAHPIALLTSPDARELLGDEHRLGIIFMALAHLLSDDQLCTAAHELGEYCAPRSIIYFTFGDTHWQSDPELSRITRFYQRAGLKTYLRTPQETLKLLCPWQPLPDGITFNYQSAPSNPDAVPASPVWVCEFMLTALPLMQRQ